MLGKESIFVRDLGYLYSIKNGENIWIFSTHVIRNDEVIYFSSIDNYIYAINENG
ncbi:PQQ-like beta-propeller repeat protein [Marinitoga sp. 38H-ov]|uniref:PQQ-like beta-propeller repeat protein n=1 Tax=Marinitoga sp. 38H-ov TaxID=1755814 RepID=UPI0013EA7246|nr:PQQ-like beta-propeller repeat protein [Marinitoga sp. 38H-ov]